MMAMAMANGGLPEAAEEKAKAKFPRQEFDINKGSGRA